MMNEGQNSQHSLFVKSDLLTLMVFGGVTSERTGHIGWINFPVSLQRPGIGYKSPEYVECHI